MLKDKMTLNQLPMTPADRVSIHQELVGVDYFLEQQSRKRATTRTKQDSMGSRLKNWITLDNESALSLFSNPELVEGIQTLSKTLVLADKCRSHAQHSRDNCARIW